MRWIKKNQSKGYSAEELKNILSSRNWSQGEIDEAVNKVNSKNKDRAISNYSLKNKKIILYIVIPAIIVVGIILLFLRPEIFGGPAQSSAQSGTQSSSISLKDCGKSLNCLELASQSCTPSQVTVSSSTTVLGVTKSKTMHYEIQGLKGGECVFYLKVDKDSLTFSPSVSQSTVDSEKASFKNQQGESGACQFKTSDLTAMLTRWEIGDFSSGDFNVASCSGSYFS